VPFGIGELGGVAEGDGGGLVVLGFPHAIQSQGVEGASGQGVA
jgi:hypothetical protein